MAHLEELKREYEEGANVIYDLDEVQDILATATSEETSDDGVFGTARARSASTERTEVRLGTHDVEAGS